MSEQKRPHLPIGYWLKRADQLLTERIDEVQRSNGLTRLDWQVLNTIEEADAVNRDDLTETLRPFADASTVEETVLKLFVRGWVSESDSGYELTSDGTAVHRQALSAQNEIRQSAVAGVSDSEYATAVGVLQRLVENLERDDAT